MRLEPDSVGGSRMVPGGVRVLDLSWPYPPRCTYVWLSDFHVLTTVRWMTLMSTPD